MHSLLGYSNSWIPILHRFADTDPTDFILRWRDRLNFSTSELAEQLTCYPKAKKKFPDIHRDGMIYTSKALEQATGEAMLRFKFNNFSGELAVDGTGGLGMDTYALAVRFKHVIYIEPDQTLLEIARHNHQLLGVKNITYLNTTLEEWVSHRPQHVDLIYVDPSRRDENSRYFKLEESSPDIRKILDDLRQRSGNTIIKTSPMLDVSYIYNSLEGVSKILCCSVNGEVKEVLTEVSQRSDHAETEGILLNSEGKVRNRITRRVETSSPATSTMHFYPDYIYKPDPAVIKAGAIPTLAEQYDLMVVGSPGFYLCGNEKLRDFPGQQFRIVEWGAYQPKKIIKSLKSNNHTRVRVHRKNFPLSTDQLYQKLKVTMGNQADLFFTRDATGKLLYFIAMREEE